MEHTEAACRILWTVGPRSPESRRHAMLIGLDVLPRVLLHDASTPRRRGYEGRIRDHLLHHLRRKPGAVRGEYSVPTLMLTVARHRSHHRRWSHVDGRGSVVSHVHLLVLNVIHGDKACQGP